MNAVLYRRVSTDQQALSMETQESLPAAYCERLGLHILFTFEDEDTSGSIPMRQRDVDSGGPALMEFLREKKVEGESIAVVCLNQDRLGRDTIDSIQTIREIWAMGHIPHLVNEGGAMPRNPENELRFEIKASIAQYERNRIRERIVTNLATKRAKGELCGTVPFGWDAIPTGQTTGKGVKIRKLVDNPEEQEWIRKMAARRAEGWSYGRIAKELNAHGVPTKRRGEVLNSRDRDVPPRFARGKWQSGNVAKVLQNATVRTWLDLTCVCSAETDNDLHDC